MTKKLNSILESLVVVMILLVLVQTFLEDFAVMVGWTWNVRIIFIYSGFIFDLFFTIEFLIRLYNAILKGRIRHYLIEEHGWIDFLASVPLIILNSGPSLLAVVAGGGFLGMGGILNILKVVKAIRIARILRLLRVLKIFKQIKYTDSLMAQRHITKITTISISIFIFTLFFFSIFGGVLGVRTNDGSWEDRHFQISNSIKVDMLGENFAPSDTDLIMINVEDKTVYTRYTDAYYDTNFGLTDYRFIRRDDMGFFFDLRELNRIQAGENIIFFVSVIILVLVFLFYYSPHFVITITDPIHVMRRGLKEANYNFEVRIQEKYADDDIFELARSYNEEFLPLKARTSDNIESTELGLKLSDLEDIFDEE